MALSFTHYTPGGKRSFRIFNVIKCDHCQCDCEDVNAMTAHEPEAKLQRLGMKRLESALDELNVTDEGDAVCSACWRTYPSG